MFEIIEGDLGVTLLAIATTICLVTILSFLWLIRTRDSSNDISVTDPGLLKKNTTYRSYEVAGHKYPSIRTFGHKHPQADKLPTKPVPLPLLVFVHGLGGSAAQFAPLLTSLINVAPCLAIDLPGCGLSSFEPRDWSAYQIQNLAAVIGQAILQHVDESQGVILIGHSLGCAFASLLASRDTPLAPIVSDRIRGFVAICPRTEPLTTKQIAHLRWLPYIPEFVINILRLVDRRGGLESASVIRYVGRSADIETKRLQLNYNEQSRTGVFLRFLYGMQSKDNGKITSTFPDKDVWAGIKIPVFCIAGESDHVCPPHNVERLADWLGHSVSTTNIDLTNEEPLPTAAGEVPLDDTKRAADTSQTDGTPVVPDFRPQQHGKRSPRDVPSFSLKTAILPKPAGHGLLYATSTVRIVSGLIESFLATQVDHRLSLGWQLQHLTTEGKWDVKNLEKWQKIQPVSNVIAGTFRAMKTLREVDDEHTPKVFVTKWSSQSRVKNGIRMVVDISHESPVYDPKGLEQGGVQYHKFPTVSKLPPTPDEVRAFIGLIDTLRQSVDDEAKGRQDVSEQMSTNGAVIAVHCHYGFNRTGFFIVSYLVERLGYRLQDAIEEFAQKRSPGIKHEHFVNELYVRYALSLQRRPTLY